jgi:hypothetical protein
MSPMRVKSRPQAGGDAPPRTPSPFYHRATDLPDIGDEDSFREVVKKLSMCVWNNFMFELT